MVENLLEHLSGVDELKSKQESNVITQLTTKWVDRITPLSRGIFIIPHTCHLLPHGLPPLLYQLGIIKDNTFVQEVVSNHVRTPDLYLIQGMD
jgi:hypothetical protein